MPTVVDEVSIKIYQKKILAVEGKDEVNYFEALLKCVGISDVQIIDVAGRGNYGKIIPALIRTKGFSEVIALAIVCDADKDANAAFESIRNILVKLSLEPPDRGNMFSSGNPKIGIFIMPGNSEAGMLEDLCLRTVGDHPAMGCVEAFMECILRFGDPPKNPAKAKAQVFLAAMPDIANCVGIGAQKGCWNFDSLELNELKSFLANLI